jgi:hypothetical protein
MGISTLWSAPEVNPINKKARSIPLLNPFNKYGRVFFFAWFGFFIVCLVVLFPDFILGPATLVKA